MSIRNGEMDLANRPWTYLTLIGSTVLVALVVGCGVGFAVNGKPEPAEIAVRGHEAAPALRSAGTPPATPTLSATNTPVAAVVPVTAAPPATKAATATALPTQAQVAAATGAHAPVISGSTHVTPTVTPTVTPLPPATPAKAPSSSNSLTSILPTVTPSSQAPTTTTP